MKVANWLVLLLLASIALAGCTKPADKPSDSSIETAFEDVVPTETRGVIKGVIVDEAIRPLAGVEVSLKDQNRKSTTTTDGLFSFIDLTPGSYFIEASKYGYNSTLTPVEVQAGVDPPILNVPLIANPSEQPYLEVIQKDGYVSCSVGGQYDYCGLVGVGGDFFFQKVEMTLGVPSWIQTELVWDSTQPATPELKLIMAQEVDYREVLVKNITGASPLVGTFNADEIAQYRFGLDSEMGLLVSSPDTGVTVQQSFTAYTHIFYRFAPPEGWLFSRDGNPPYPA